MSTEKLVEDYKKFLKALDSDPFSVVWTSVDYKYNDGKKIYVLELTPKYFNQTNVHILEADTFKCILSKAPIISFLRSCIPKFLIEKYNKVWIGPEISELIEEEQSCYIITISSSKHKIGVHKCTNGLIHRRCSLPEKFVADRSVTIAVEDNYKEVCEDIIKLIKDYYGCEYSWFEHKYCFTK